MLFGEINSFLSIAEKVSGFARQLFSLPQHTIAQRFVQLFEAHGVHRNQIPRLLELGLTVADVADDDALTAALTEDIIAKSCTLFGVRREWLDGASDQIYPLHHFYKSPQEFAPFVRDIKARSLTLTHGLVMKCPSRGYEEDTVIVIAEAVAFLDNKTIYRHHVCPGWSYRYWKSRAYLTACIAIAWKDKLYLHGLDTEHATMRRYTAGTGFINAGSDSVLPIKGKRWEPEDMAIHPEAFLDGVAPERGQFGLRAGLAVWLELYDQGFMETGLPHAGVRAKFSQQLERLST